MGEKPTRLYFACALSLFCSLRSLFSGILHDVAVVVFINSVESSRLPKIDCLFLVKPPPTKLSQVATVLGIFSHFSLHRIVFLSTANCLFSKGSHVLKNLLTTVLVSVIGRDGRIMLICCDLLKLILF